MNIDLIRSSLWVTPKKPRDITSTILVSIKCLWLTKVSFYQEKCLSQKPSGRYISLEELQDDQPQITPLVGKIVSPLGAQVLVPVVLIEVVDVPIRRSSRQSKAPRRDPIEGYIVHESHKVLISDKEEPTT